MHTAQYKLYLSLEKQRSPLIQFTVLQTRIVLNKADTVKPEELMRVQSALIWNISPLMSSAQPPVMYTVSLWSMPYEVGAPVRLLQAQERELLRDLRQAVDKRIENKIASARRFAVSFKTLNKLNITSSRKKVILTIELWFCHAKL